MDTLARKSVAILVTEILLVMISFFIIEIFNCTGINYAFFDYGNIAATYFYVLAYVIYGLTVLILKYLV